MKSIQKIKNIKNKKVLVRVDFNVPIGDDGVVNDGGDWRIRATIPTIQYLLEKETKIILMTHLGRPRHHQVSNIKHQVYSLKLVAEKLEKLLNKKIKFIDDCIGNKVKEEIKKIQTGEIILLENLRFYKEEEENNKNFAKELASFADIYINDAFSVSHRRHASVVSITKFLPSYAGLLLEKEIKILSSAMHNPKRPATIVIGGAKIKTKLPVIKNLLNKFDHILVGGVVANIILRAKGIDTGKSLSEEIDLTEVKKIDLSDNRISIPLDAIICCSGKNSISLSVVGKIGDNQILDIGPDSRELYADIISISKTIIWNGPMGKFENDEFIFGTKEVAKAIVKSDSYKIIGGGDTITVLDQLGYLDKIDYVCTGGGAMLKFLAGEKLPGIEVLK